MLLGYVYKLRPNLNQSLKMDDWLSMLRSHYNWCLADRITTYQHSFIVGEYCDLRTKGVAAPVSCCILRGGATGEPWTKEGKKRSAGRIQDAQLPSLKKARPWYRDIHSNVLQRNIARLDKAYQNFFEQGRGFPNFRNKSNFRSFEYKPSDVKFKGSKVYLPKIGWLKFFKSRSFPEGFKIRSVTIRKKADGWYMSVRLEQTSIPDFPVISKDEVKTVIGLDMGITKLVHGSDGSQADNQRFSTNQKNRRILRIRQRRVNRKQKGSKNRGKMGQRVAKYHQNIRNKRDAYQWKVAYKNVKKADCIVVEDLNISGMRRRCKPKKDEKGRFLPNGQSAKRALNRAIADVAWGELISKIEYTAAKSGKIFVKVDPKKTSQTCSVCGHVDGASRDREKFICTNCGHLDHADKQAARNIKQKAIDLLGLKIKTVKKKVRQDLSEPKQLSLFETPLESTVFSEQKKQHRASRNQKKVKGSERDVPGNLSAKQLSLFEDIPGNQSA